MTLVLIANRTRSSTDRRRRSLRCRLAAPGDPHPYIIGKDADQRYMTVVLASDHPVSFSLDVQTTREDASGIASPECRTPGPTGAPYQRL